MFSARAIKVASMSTFGACVALAAAVLLAMVPARAEAADVRLADKPTGLTVTAPKGYKLKQANGYYTVSGKGSFVVFMRGVSPIDLKATAAALVKQSGGKVVGKATSTPALYRATVSTGKRLYVLRVRKVGGQFDISLAGPGTPPLKGRSARAGEGNDRANRGRLVQLSRTQLAQVAVLERIVNSRRGGAAALVNVPIPMRLATTADFLASANVPDLPGWQVDGGTGLFTVTHDSLGFGWFGLTIAALTPQFSFGRPGIDVIVTPSADLGTNMVNVLSQYFPQQLRHPFAFTQVQEVPGTRGILGPTIPSALFQVRFTWRGHNMQGLFLWGTTNQTDILLNSYFSAVAVNELAPGSYSNALLQSWASANGEAGFRERLSTSLENLADRPDREFILTPSRFRSDASTWISLLASGAR